jgi:hypothetical protein
VPLRFCGRPPAHSARTPFHHLDPGQPDRRPKPDSQAASPRRGASTEEHPCRPAGVDAQALTSVLDDRWAALRAGLRAETAAEPYRDAVGLSVEAHRARVFDALRVLAADLDLLGCFAITEHGHGSDVQHLRTTATYHPATAEFVVHTPDRGATKEYIGNAARDGHAAVVFAQLTTHDGARGVHAFVVPIRDGEGGPLPGVTIEDCGPKAGLNGVDNGRLAFDHVRVPREALLNRLGDVAPDGTYSSPIEGDARRFFTAPLWCPVSRQASQMRHRSRLSKQ